MAGVRVRQKTYQGRRPGEVAINIGRTKDLERHDETNPKNEGKNDSNCK